MLKKIILSILTFFILFGSTISPVLAAEEFTWYNQGFFDWYVKVYDDKTSPSNEIFGERYTAAQVQWILYGILSQPFNFLGKDNRDGLMCMFKLVGQNTVDLSTCADALLTVFNPIKDFFEKYVAYNVNRPNSIAGVVGSLKHNGFSGIGYIEGKLTNLSIIPTVEAQGYAYRKLSNTSISRYWGGVRDVSYALVVLIMIVFSFMIMFRVKINPQTVISMQIAIPKIVIAVILATFSFAIAGLLIDLSYVVAGVLASLMNVANFASFQQAYNFMVPPGDFGGFWIFLIMFIYTILFVLALIVALFSVLASFTALTAIVPTVLWTIMMVLLTIWTLILCIWYAFRVPWILIKNLINIYISIVTAPIQIIAGAIIPSAGFVPWMKKLFAELLVFPITGLFFLLAFKLLLASMITSFEKAAITNVGVVLQTIIQAITGINTPVQTEILWAPSIIGSAEMISPFLYMLASFGIIVAIPKVVDILKMAILGQKFDYGSAIGEAMSPVQGAWGQVKGSPVYRTFSEGAGYITAAKMLDRARESTFWGNVMNKTSRVTGIDTSNAEEVSTAWRSRAQQKQKTG